MRGRGLPHRLTASARPGSRLSVKGEGVASRLLRDELDTAGLAYARDARRSERAKAV